MDLLAEASPPNRTVRTHTPLMVMFDRCSLVACRSASVLGWSTRLMVLVVRRSGTPSRLGACVGRARCCCFGAGENSSFSLTDTHSIVAAIVVVVVYYGL